MIKEFDLLDQISIFASASLSSDDVNIVTLLYGPLIKSDAYKLYMTLSSLLERSSLKSENYLHKDLLDLLDFNAERFFKARMRLEAIGLLETYQNNNEYILLLKLPLTAKQFLTDGVLGMYLYSELGDSQFKRLQHLFSVQRIDKANYEEITANFDDVFESVAEVKIPHDDLVLDHKMNKGINIKNYRFDFNLFQEGIAKTFLSGRRITPKFESFITNIAYAYGYNEEEMQEIYAQSLNNSGFFDYQLCSRKAREIYKNNHENNLPRMNTLEKITMSKNEKMFTEISAKALIATVSGNKVATAHDLEKVNTLYENYPDLPRGLLNLCVIYSINKCNGEVPAFSYFDKVIKDWLNKGMNSFEVCYLEVLKDKPKAKAKKKVQTNDPDWLKEYEENFESEVEDL